MADQQQLSLLGEKVSLWNKWQRRHSNMRPDFRNGDLRDAQLSFAQLPRADLHEAILSKASLCNANLRYVDLSEADLSYANLKHADLSHADLTNANLSFAQMQHANLHQTLFKDTLLSDTNLSYALLRDTIFANIDLSRAIGLDTVYQLTPSTIGLDTLSRSKTAIPEAFLHGAKIHKNLLTSIHEQGKAPFDYFTTFISYAGEDREFVQSLHDALQQAGVWCWFAPSSLRAGDYFKGHLDKAIKQCEKMLVVLSEHSVASNWVRYEVDLARQKERKRNTRVLVPICIDTAVLDKLKWATFIHKSRHIRVFEDWTNPSSYQESLKLLLSDLRMDS